jgi:hypothetical protein
MTIPVVLIVGADKGGVGKTFISRTLMDYYKAAPGPVRYRAFDTEAPLGMLELPDWRFGMTYIVQANVEGSEDAISISLVDRQSALAAALRWLAQGYTGVKIIGDARLYTPEELAKVLQDKPT